MTNTRFIGIEERERFCSDSIDDFHDWLGLVVQDELVGFVEYEDDGDNEIFIHLIEVNEVYRNKGFATLLLDELKRLFPSTMAFTGESTGDALPFWMVKNVHFHPSVQREVNLLSIDLTKSRNMEGFLFPFALSLSSEYRPYWTK